MCVLYTLTPLTSISPSIPLTLHFTEMHMHRFYFYTAKYKVLKDGRTPNAHQLNTVLFSPSQLLCLISLTSILPFHQQQPSTGLIFPTPHLPCLPRLCERAAFRGHVSVTLDFLLHAELQFHHVDLSDQKKKCADYLISTDTELQRELLDLELMRIKRKNLLLEHVKVTSAQVKSTSTKPGAS